MRYLDLHGKNGVCRILTGDSIDNVNKYIRGRNCVIIADEYVHHLYHNRFPDYPVIKVGQGEDSKRLENVSRIFEELLELEVDRSWFILGIGGGITTDLAGFIASSYMRGISFGFVATTLLGQVDAAIGGKNGVNLKGYKNIIGTIRQPEFVICDISLLTTLEKREFLMGWAEVIKYAVIRDRSFFDFLVKNKDKGLRLDEGVMNEIVYQSVKSKVEVVEGDEFEEGNRKLLNFGHTFAHGLEKLYSLPHGEAVSIGMTLAARVSVNRGILDNDEAEKLINLLKRVGLPVSFDFDPAELTSAMRKDKKRTGDTIQLVLLNAIGEAVVTAVPVNDLKSLLYDLR